MAKDTSGFSAEEREAMKERAKELKANKNAEKSAADVLKKISELPDEDRVLAEKIHEIVLEAAPHLVPKTWYGMPGYARDGEIVVFFQGAAKFKSRYSTIGFQDPAQLDDGDFWPTAFAVTKITPTVTTRISDLVKKAAG